nr:MAG TPA: hypothetical protein [Caudoviricetes sp.]
MYLYNLKLKRQKILTHLQAFLKLYLEQQIKQHLFYRFQEN